MKRSLLLLHALMASVARCQFPQLPDTRLRKPLQESAPAAHPYRRIGRCHAALASTMYHGPAGPVCCDTEGQNCGCADYYCAGSTCCAADAAVGATGGGAARFPLRDEGKCACASVCGAARAATEEGTGGAQCCDGDSCCCHACGCVATSLPGYHAALQRHEHDTGEVRSAAAVAAKTARAAAAGQPGWPPRGARSNSTAPSRHVWLDSGSNGAALVVAALAVLLFFVILGLGYKAEKSSRDFVYAEEMIAMT